MSLIFPLFQSEEFEISNSQADASQDIDYSKPDPAASAKGSVRQARSAMLSLSNTCQREISTKIRVRSR